MGNSDQVMTVTGRGCDPHVLTFKLLTVNFCLSFHMINMYLNIVSGSQQNSLHVISRYTHCFPGNDLFQLLATCSSYKIKGYMLVLNSKVKPQTHAQNIQIYRNMPI